MRQVRQQQLLEGRIAEAVLLHVALRSGNQRAAPYRSTNTGNRLV